MINIVFDHNADNPDFLHGGLFSSKVNFYINREVNQQNVHYWSQDNLHWYSLQKEQDVQETMVSCRFWDTHILHPFFFQNTVNGEHYMNILDALMLEIHLTERGIPQCDSCKMVPPPHYTLPLRHWLDTFPGH
jgi:hypothetical protein